MAKFKFHGLEVVKMKAAIKYTVLAEKTTNPQGEITAWRLHLALKAMVKYATTERNKHAAERELALYEKLTENDLPNWENVYPKFQGTKLQKQIVAQILGEQAIRNEEKNK